MLCNIKIHVGKYTKVSFEKGFTDHHAVWKKQPYFLYRSLNLTLIKWIKNINKKIFIW